MDILSISYEIDLRWMPWEFTSDKSTLVQVMPWCHQAITNIVHLFLASDKFYFIDNCKTYQS